MTAANRTPATNTTAASSTRAKAVPDLFAITDPDPAPLRPIYLIAFEDLRPGTAAYGNTCAKLQRLANRHDTELIMAEPSDGRIKRYLSAFRLAWACRRNGGIAYHRNFPFSPIAGLLSGTKHMVIELNGPPTDATTAYPQLAWLGGLYRRAYELFLKQSPLIVTATTGLADYARTVAPRAQVIIAPAAAPELAEQRNEETERSVDKNPKQVVYFGTFAPWQGVELLLDAVDSDLWPADVELVVIGDADKTEAGRALAKHPKVRAVGRLPHDKTLGLVESSLCSLSPKTYQLDAEVKTGLWPVKVIESLAVGTAVIGTKIEDQLSFIETSGGGVLIESTGAAVAEAVAAMVADPEAAIEMGRIGQRHVSSKHSLDVRADFMQEYLADVSRR